MLAWVIREISLAMKRLFYLVMNIKLLKGIQGFDSFDGYDSKDVVLNGLRNGGEHLGPFACKDISTIAVFQLFLCRMPVAVRIFVII